LPPDPVHALEAIATWDGPPLARTVEQAGGRGHLAEFAIHRSAYQLKEADPHTFAIPRLDGRGRSAMIEIQVDEYGGGRPGEAHAELFAAAMTDLDLDPTFGHYVDRLPGSTLATDNLVSLFALQRRLRGALIGHLALFEMCSVTPMSRYLAAATRDEADFVDVRGQAGQIRSAALLRDLLSGSEIRESHRVGDPRVQDAYALRCMPQVHGPVHDLLRFADDIIGREINAATDNPLVFEDGALLSGGNFHGQAVAMVLDMMAIAMTNLAVIAERRIDRLVHPDLNQGLPPFLTKDALHIEQLRCCAGIQFRARKRARLVSHPHRCR